MPVQYWCSTCGLLFDVGLYHSHKSDRVIGLDYTALVCATCGVQYQAHHTLREKADKDSPVITEFRCQPAPQIVSLGTDTHPRAIIRELMKVTREWEYCCTLETAGQILSNLSEVVCCQCGTQGSLTGYWQEDFECPHCGTVGMKRVGQWMT